MFPTPARIDNIRLKKRDNEIKFQYFTVE
jgi:hypothetical protein